MILRISKLLLLIACILCLSCNLSVISFAGKAEDCSRLENGEKLYFQSEYEMFQLIDYYYMQYQLYNQTCPYHYVYDQTGCEVWLDKVEYSHSRIHDKIISTFGLPKGNTEEEIIRNAVSSLVGIRYDKTAALFTIEDSIDQLEGVCWHFAKIASVLLNEVGIYTETVSGIYIPQKDYHTWIKCSIHGEFRYVDVTLCKTKGMPESIFISRENYARDYCEKKTIKLYQQYIETKK